MSAPEKQLAGAIAGSGLIPPGSTGVVMLSGGADSCAMALGLARACRPQSLVALHLNYGLREESGGDEAAARTVCEDLGVELVVIRPDRDPGGSGNLHAWARELRYSEAEALRAGRDLDWIAVAHTRSDLAETVLYRLATSPGTRALAAMPARRGAIVRPLLSLTRAEVRAAAKSAGLPFVDDRSNEDPTFARSRIRHEVLPVLEDIGPAAIETIARTRDEIGEELDFITTAAAALIEDDGTILASRLQAAHPAVRRHALRLAAEVELGRSVALNRETAERICRLAAAPEGGSVDLGGGDRLVAEAGLLLVHGGQEKTGGESPAGAVIPLPGGVSWGGWSLSVEEMSAPFLPEGPGVATLDADRLGDRIEVRGWQQGDRIRPLGMAGSKSLQDLFTDAGLRRSLRRSHPVVLAAGEVAWVPGLAVAHDFRLTAQTRRALRITAGPDQPSPQGGPGAGPKSA